MATRVNPFSFIRRCVHTNSWKVPVSPGGTLKARLPTTCSLNVYPLNPHKHDWNEAFVEMHVLGEVDDSFISLETAQKVSSAFKAIVVADYEPGRNFLQIEAPVETTPTAFARSLHRLRSWLGDPFRGERPLFDSRIVFNVGIPGRFDLDVELSSGVIMVDGTFEGDVRVHTNDADVVFKKLKSMYVDIDVDDGDISMDTVQGNVFVRSGAGNVDIGRVQGPSVKLISDSGDVQVRAMYADYGLVRSREGTIRLGGAQGYTKIRSIESSVEVAGVEGRLDVETDSGDIEAELSKPETVSLRSRWGDIALGLPEVLKGTVLFEGGNSVKIDDQVKVKKDESVTPVIKGEVHLSCSDNDAVTEKNMASIYARAPGGDLSVTRRPWSAKLYSLLRNNKDSFPRWVENR